MSLTSHLKNPASCIRAFLYEQFPNTQRVWRECPPAPSDAATIRPQGKVPHGTLATAFDYRLRYYFAATPARELVATQSLPQLIRGSLHLVTPRDSGESEVPFPETLAFEFLQAADRLVQRLQPAGRRMQRTQEELLGRLCIVLALFEEVVRAGVWPGSPLVTHGPATVADLLAIAERNWLDDLCALSWAFYDQFAELLSHPAILNPTFDGSADVGGADADLIVDDCLIDIKTTVQSKRDGDWLRQLMGYVLLDYSDRYQMRSVGIYLSRQQILYRWPLDALIATLTGGDAPSLSRLRDQFRPIAQNRPADTRVPR